MKALLPLIASLVSGEVGLMIGKAKRDAVFLAVIAFFAIVAIIFGLAALEVALAVRYGALYACLIIAVAALVICLVLFIAMKITDARARREIRRREADAAAYTSAAFTLLPAVFRSKEAMAVGIPLAALAGFLLVPRRSRKGRRD